MSDNVLKTYGLKTLTLHDYITHDIKVVFSLS